MRLISLFFSLALHVAVIAAGMYFSMGSSRHIDLSKRVYTIDLVTLAPVGSKQSAPRRKSRADASTGPAMSIAKVVPKSIPRLKSAQKSPHKIRPKKIKKIKKRIRNVPAKKKVSSRQLLARALKGVQARVAGQERQEQHFLAKELARLRKQLGKNTNSGVSESGGTGAQGSGLIQVYGQLAELVIKEHWRFPRVGGPNLIVQVEVLIDHSGKVLRSKILTSSGRPDFDASAQRAVKEAEQLPKPPSRDIRRLIINFNLNELGE